MSSLLTNHKSCYLWGCFRNLPWFAYWRMISGIACLLEDALSLTELSICVSSWNVSVMNGASTCWWWASVVPQYSTVARPHLMISPTCCGHGSCQPHVTVCLSWFSSFFTWSITTMAMLMNSFSVNQVRLKLTRGHLWDVVPSRSWFVVF